VGTQVRFLENHDFSDFLAEFWRLQIQRESSQTGSFTLERFLATGNEVVGSQVPVFTFHRLYPTKQTNKNKQSGTYRSYIVHLELGLQLHGTVSSPICYARLPVAAAHH
jgi:hypothetical protein